MDKEKEKSVQLNNLEVEKIFNVQLKELRQPFWVKFSILTETENEFDFFLQE